MKKINLKGVSETLSEREMKDVKGGQAYGGTAEEYESYLIDIEGNGNNDGRNSQPCPSPKRGCNGPVGTFTDGGICCLGPWGPGGWLGQYCYAVLQGLNKCP